MINPTKKLNDQVKQDIMRMQNMSDEEVLDYVTQIEMKPSLLLLSGGLDTTTILYWLYSLQIPFTAMSINYGQEASKEIEFAKKQCEKFKVNHVIVNISGGVIDGYTAPGENKIMEDNQLIPNRNSVFLSLAVSYALQHGFERVYIGVTKESSPSFCDCQLGYIHQMNICNLVNDLKTVVIKAPLIDMTKSEIMSLAIDLGLNLEDTWSCAENGEFPCGVCINCVLRKHEEMKFKRELERKLSFVNRSLRMYDV